MQSTDKLNKCFSGQGKGGRGEVLEKGIANDWVTIRWSYPQEVMDRIAQCTVCLCQGGLEHVIMAADVSCFLHYE